MKRSTRLEKIADINVGFENVAAASLTSTAAEYRAQENLLEQLLQYKEEYQQQLGTRLKNAISATEMRDYQYFFASLDKAIEQQVGRLDQITLLLEASKNNWLSKKREVSKMSRAAENQKNIEDAIELNHEQKESDEANLRLFTMKNNLLQKH